MLVVPLRPARVETRAGNSRFIASIARADSPEAARAYIRSIKDEFPDATHNVPAFLIGGGSCVTEFCSDDGEPSGTSGRPVLAVLKGSGLGNAAIVVTRYFGGTLLGTGGLVKAYGDAAKAALAAVERAELVPARLASIELPYQRYEGVKALILGLGAELTREGFGELVSLELVMPIAAQPEFERRLSELGAGTLSPVYRGETSATRPL